MKKLILLALIGLVSCKKYEQHEITFINNSDETMFITSESLGISTDVPAHGKNYVYQYNGTYEYEVTNSNNVTYTDYVIVNNKNQIVELKY
jgi:hypothetical protein